MNKLKDIVIIILISLFMIAIIPKEFQNDTFFTIALGQRMLEYGIEEEDHLVWHEGLNFIHLRWAFDLVITIIYNMFNFFGIYLFVLIIGIIIALLYYCILNSFTNKKNLSFVVTLFVMILVGSGGITARGQIMSYLLLLLEFGCIENLLKTNKNIYFVILIFIPLLLVNFHASVFPIYFVMYMPYIAEFLLSKLKLKSHDNSKIIIQKRSIKKLVILIVIGILLGFCSPIGINSYTYMFKVMSGASTKFISELQEVNLINNCYFTIIIIVVLGIVGFTKTKIRVTDAFFIVGFILMALPTFRCIFYFYLISTICIARIFSDCLNTYNVKFDFISKRMQVIIIILFYLLVFFFSIRNIIVKRLSEDYVKNNSYPIEATSYILRNIDVSNMRIYNHFNFGSYLEFKGIPVFIDSRSELYTPEFNKDCEVLDDWYYLEYGVKSYKEIFEKYKITHALLYNTEVISIYIADDDDWKLIYHDNTFSIYEKVK